MSAQTTRYEGPPLTGLLMTALALLALGAAWISASLLQASRLDLQTGLLAVAFTLAAILADRHPVHVAHHTKVAVTTVPLFLMAALLPPPLAGLAAGVAVLVGEVSTRSEYGNHPEDIALSVARCVVVASLGGIVAHLPAPHPALQGITLVAAAGVMFLGDLLLSTLELAPMSGIRPGQVFARTLREAGLMETAQYLFGILLAAAAHRYLWTIVLLVLPMGVLYVAFKQMKELRGDTRQLLEGMADAVDLRDPYTGGHSRRVTAFVEDILKELELSGPDVDLIVSAARVHDLGKIGIPDAILRKTARLDAEEWAEMQTHPVRGAELLSRYPDFARGAEIVRHHHESWDGGGYPDRLAGMEIPFGARVIAVADSFDAMTSDRPYRPGMPCEKAAQILREGRGRQWDAEVVEAFLRSLNVGEAQAG